jgi:integrase
MDNSSYVEPSRVTFADFLRDDWLPSLGTRGLRAATLTSYQMTVEAHVIPRFGSVYLQQLSPTDLNRVYAQLLVCGRRDGSGGLSARSVRYVHMLVRKALADAARWGKVVHNVADLADPPRASAARADAERARRIWTAAELRRFLDHVREDRLYALYVLAGTTGMRRGELAGLRWQDIDFERARLSVSQTIVTVGRKTELSTPKTASGRRLIALDSQTVEALRLHRTQQAEERLALGLGHPGPHGLVFTQIDGSLLHPNAVTHAFAHRIKNAQVPKIRFHDLRHTHASLALAAGVHVKVVQERLGHSTSSITLDIYSHAIPAMQEDAAQRVASLIFGTDSR